MSLPDFSKLKRSAIFGGTLKAVRDERLVPRSSSTAPGVLDSPTPPLPPAPDGWGDKVNPFGFDGRSTPRPSESPRAVVDWREALLLAPGTLAMTDADVADRVRTASVDELNEPQGLSGTTVLLDLCRHGLVDAIHAALDQGADATRVTVQALSAVDLLVLPAMEQTTPDPAAVDGPAAWLLNPSERQLIVVERLLAGGARFDPDLVPLLAGAPLGIRLEQRALRATMGARPPAKESGPTAAPSAAHTPSSTPSAPRLARRL